MALVEVVGGLAMVGPGLGVSEVDGVGAEGHDTVGRGMEGAGKGVVVAVALGEQGGTSAHPRLPWCY